jgi:hypothetical protein
MLKDIIELEKIKEKTREQFILKCTRWRSDGGFMTADGLDFLAMNVFNDAIIENTAQIVAREMLRKVRERMPEVSYFRDMRNTNRNEFREEVLTHLQSLEDELSAEVLSK